MRITCPFCGERDAREFTYRGDATVTRPTPEAGADAAIAYVYLRPNPAGVHREEWQHASGCRAWLVVTRDTRNHSILAVASAAGSDRGAIS